MNTGRLLKLFRRHEKICILYSGGFDSRVLLQAAAIAGRDRILALTARSPLLAGFYRDLITAAAGELKVEHCFVDVNILMEGDFAKNGPDRCYLCKKAMFRELGRKASEEGCSVVMDGTLPDDLKEDRPGLRAAKEAGVAHPFVQAGLDRRGVAELGAALGVEQGKLPSDSCLATRIPRGRRISPELLRTVELVESLLKPRAKGRIRARIEGGEIVLDHSAVDEEAVLERQSVLKEAAESRGMGFRLNRL